uniref:YqaJ viral recombinase domain-containing protein n=1 Tax=Kryptolebias marmoratus TaxID=37003 RepID=A0A3Q3AYZ8_KRYMA
MTIVSANSSISPPLILLVLDGLSTLELVPSKFGPVPQGSPMSYQSPLEKSCGSIILHHIAPDFPALPLMLHNLPNMCFVLTLGQLMHLQSLQISLQMCYEIESRTREQSRCPAWVQLRQPRLTASHFRDACRGSAKEESAAMALAAWMIRGSKRQTAAIKRGLQMESEVLANDADILKVNVLPVGFIIHPDTPYLGATPDGRVYDPSESPPFGLVEVKSSTKNDVSQVAHLKVYNGHACLRCSYAYFWQVQGQLAITGLEWCDFVTDTLTTITVEQVWRDESFIAQMKSKLDMFYFNTFINVFMSMQ